MSSSGAAVDFAECHLEHLQHGRFEGCGAGLLWSAEEKGIAEYRTDYCWHTVTDI